MGMLLRSLEKKTASRVNSSMWVNYININIIDNLPKRQLAC